MHCIRYKAEEGGGRKVFAFGGKMITLSKATEKINNNK